jgi:hypothetical protein
MMSTRCESWTANGSEVSSVNNCVTACSLTAIVAECDGADRSAARYEAPNRAAAFFTSFGATQKIAP